jgi:SH3-like domain-containing protein
MSRRLILLPLLLSFFLAGNSIAMTMSVRTEKLFLMSGPGKNADVKWQYDKGFPLKILSSRGTWVKVEDFEKDSGWVPKDSLSDKPAVVVKANKDTQGKVNIHSGPGLKYKVIGKAFYGVVFEKIGQEDGWIKVHHDSGLTGWIKSTLLWGSK